MEHDGSIFVVEDDAEIRSALAEVLSAEGYTVVTAAHGRAAMDLLATRIPRLILMDLMMPVMNGWDLCAALRQDPRLAQIPVIMLSAVASEQHRVALAAVGYLRKPLQLDSVLALIEEHLRPR